MDAESSTPEDPKARHRRLAEIFGDGLPSQTRDDLPDPRENEEASTDAWLRAQVPPHHG